MKYVILNNANKLRKIIANSLLNCPVVQLKFNKFKGMKTAMYINYEYAEKKCYYLRKLFEYPIQNFENNFKLIFVAFLSM